MSTPESGGAAPPAKKLAAADEDVLSVLFERWDVLAEDEDIRRRYRRLPRSCWRSSMKTPKPSPSSRKS